MVAPSTVTSISTVAPSTIGPSTTASTSAPATIGVPIQARLAGLDAYRGFVMLLMMAEVLHFSEIAAAVPGSAFWRFLAYHQSHVEWIGCSLHDLIQPSFSFLVGAALPFSLGARQQAGLNAGRVILSAWRRALILILLGIFLRSTGKPLTYFTFEDTLTQIGLGYGFLVLLGWSRARTLWLVFAAILVGYGIAFAQYPLPPETFDRTKVGVPLDWPHWLSGFAAHWNKNVNLAADFDVWFLNLWPRETPFAFNDGGYQTFNFVPTLATMILGLLAGRVLRESWSNADKVGWLVLLGCAGIVSGLLLSRLGVNPLVKRIWTPSWVLFSGGWCFLLTAAFYAVLDGWGSRRWAFPLLVIGMNSIAAYVLTELMRYHLAEIVKPHVGLATTWLVGTAYQPLLTGAVVLALLWLALLWMYRRKIFLRV